jgi:hypothetical protein
MTKIEQRRKLIEAAKYEQPPYECGPSITRAEHNLYLAMFNDYDALLEIATTLDQEIRAGRIADDSNLRHALAKFEEPP